MIEHLHLRARLEKEFAALKEANPDADQSFWLTHAKAVLIAAADYGKQRGFEYAMVYHSAWNHAGCPLSASILASQCLRDHPTVAPYLEHLRSSLLSGGSGNYSDPPKDVNQIQPTWKGGYVS